MKFLSILTLIVLLSAVAAGQWVQTAGPCGGAVYALASGGSSLFAGTFEHGVYRSTDHGGHWFPADSGFPATYLSVWSLLYNNPNLFAATDWGLYRSTDNGGHWAAFDSGMTDSPGGFTLFGTSVFASTSDGVYRLSGGSSVWDSVNTGLTNRAIYAISSNPTTIFLGTAGGGIFRSTNSGNSWIQADSGLTDLTVYAIGSFGTTTYAGTGSGVFASTDNGRSWSTLNTGMNATYFTSFAGAGSYVFAGTGSGMFRMMPILSTWAPAVSGLANPYILSIALDGSALLAGTSGGGVFRSTDYGATWSGTSTGLPYSEIWTLSQIGSTLFAGTYNGGGIFRSSDAGTTWTPANAGMSTPYIRFIAPVKNAIITGTLSGIFRSSNGGDSWTPSGYTNDVLCSLTVDSMIFVGTMDSGTIRSTDQGLTWLTANAGLENEEVDALTAVGATLFAGTHDMGVCRSTDFGGHWAQVNNGLLYGEVRTLATSGSILFAGTLGPGYNIPSTVFRSTDLGDHWSTQITDGSYISSAVIGKNIVAAGGHIIISSDSGASWSTADSGLITGGFFSLAADGSNLYAGTGILGVIRCPLSDLISSVHDHTAGLPGEFRLEQNFPNPFNPLTVISFTLPARSAITLKIYDALGKEIATLASGELTAGTYTRVWNPAGAASGVYFCRLQAGKFFATKKLMLLK
ncbi:MAG TPA: T9SS type A sorting domain-containing protein [Bacteroidota bacterium]|nr:T9SS type A sorting domain-containing protein [Bacteroidota bacterium]